MERDVQINKDYQQNEQIILLYFILCEYGKGFLKNPNL